MRHLLFQRGLLNREKITLFIGCLVLSAGAIFPWYRLPKPALEIFDTNLNFTIFPKILMAIIAIMSFASIFVFNFRRILRLLFWMGLIVVLLFPYLVTTWYPNISFLASNYYQQASSVARHVDRNFSEVQSQWKQNISLATPQAPPDIFEISITDSRFFQMSSWDKILLNGYGYKDSFLAFIARGWIYSLFGLVISLIGFYLRQAENNLHIQDINKAIIIFGLIFSIIFVSIVGANIVNYHLETQFAKGEYTAVVNRSKILAALYPPIQGDKDFLERLAKANFYTDNSDPALTNFVKGIENYNIGNYIAAENYFQNSLKIKPNIFLFRGYLASSILHQGVSFLQESNNRNPGAAADIFEKVLSIFPGHIEALYDLMLARTVNAEYQKSADVAQQIIDEQSYFQEPKIGLIGQSYLHLTWGEYHNGDVNKAWERYRQSVDSSAWKKGTGKRE